MDKNNMQTNGGNNNIPIFTPPTPAFTPPTNVRPTFSGPACYYHQDEPCVAKCAKCGKYICKDCFDNYGVSSGDYAGQALCYDCTRQLVEENVKILKKNKVSITITFVLTLIGMLIGATCVPEGGIGMFVAMCIGGCLWTFLKCWGATVIGTVLAGGCNFTAIFVSIILGFFIQAVLSIGRTIKKVIESIVYLKRTSGLIKSDAAALQQMMDYMEYSMIRNQNRGVDIETLLNQQSELANNTYAQMVRNQGEDAAEASIRGCVASINESGEIIRNFAA